MGRTKANPCQSASKLIRPAISPEAEETQMVALATQLAKQRLINGTATSQEVCFYLKLGTQQAKLERERLEEENKLLRAKTETLERAANSEVDYAKVLRALKKYQGQEEESYEGVYCYDPEENVF